MEPATWPALHRCTDLMSLCLGTCKLQQCTKVTYIFYNKERWFRHKTLEVIINTTVFISPFDQLCDKYVEFVSDS